MIQTLEIRINKQPVDVRKGDVFEVMRIENGSIYLEHVYRRDKTPVELPPLGVNVADGIGVGDRMGG